MMDGQDSPREAAYDAHFVGGPLDGRVLRLQHDARKVEVFADGEGWFEYHQTDGPFWEPSGPYAGPSFHPEVIV